MLRAAMLLWILCLSACYAPDGGLFPTTGRGYSYVSTPDRPLTVSVVDIRTGDTIFRMEVPPEKQLTFRFIVGGGSGKGSTTPDRLDWEIWKAGTLTGRLRNEVPCPPQDACRIDVAVRAPEAVPPPEESGRYTTVDPNALPAGLPTGGTQ